MVGENELARLADHLLQWDLHWRAFDEAQMEVLRRLQVIEMVGMRWGIVTHLMEEENLSLVAELRRGPIFQRGLIQGFSSYFGKF